MNVQSPELAGKLEVVGLASLLQLAEAEDLTGVLRLPGDASVSLNGGLPVDARCLGLEGARGLMACFFVRSGPFAFEVEEVSGDALGSVVGFIMEGCRLDDEWVRLAPRVLARTADATTDLGPLAQQLDGERTLDEAVRAAELHPVLVVDNVLAGLEVRALTDAQPPAPARVGAWAPEQREPLPDMTELHFFDLLDQGRRAIKAGDLPLAETYLTEASARRPDDRSVQQNLRRIEQMREGDFNPRRTLFRHQS